MAAASAWAALVRVPARQAGAPTTSIRFAVAHPCRPPMTRQVDGGDRPRPVRCAAGSVPGISAHSRALAVGRNRHLVIATIAKVPAQAIAMFTGSDKDLADC